MIKRTIEGEFRTLMGEFPVVTVLGPRQAGKTTLVRNVLPDFTYVSMEDPDNRRLAETDPRDFLSVHSNKVIFDEVQRVPELLSYLQGMIDDRNEVGQFVLTGSHQLELSEAVSQSLAGRTAILILYPLSLAELAGAGIEFPSFREAFVRGFLPGIYDKDQRPSSAYASYLRTYVERDVRLMVQLKDQTLFEKFLVLLAGRIGQLVDFSSLGNDVGVDGKTIKHWLSILEASFIVFRLPPYFENFGKRVIKSAKVYFTEPGLAAHLLGISTPEQLRRDPLVGNLFENLVIVEAMKARANQGHKPNLYFFRDSNGNEIDLLYGGHHKLTGIEIKSGATYNQSFKKGLIHFDQNVRELAGKYLVYNGKPMDFSDGVRALDFRW